MNGIFPELHQLFPQPKSTFPGYTSTWKVTLQSVNGPECKQSFLKQEASTNTVNQTRSKSLLRKKETRKTKKVMKNSHAVITHENTKSTKISKVSFMYV